MKKYLFCGGYKSNSGPSNVNRDYVNNLPESFAIIKEINKYLQPIQIIPKVMKYKVVVVSALSRDCYMSAKIAKRFNKKLVYIMHGNCKAENEINGITDDIQGEAIEKYILDNADLILAVSKTYMLKMQELLPEHAHKISFLTNGIYEPDFSSITAKKDSLDHKSIIVIGGERKQKNNRAVSDAIEQIDNAKLYVYGIVKNEDYLNDHSHTEVIGKVDRDILLEKMKKCDLFVLNSYLESFSMATIEALSLGLSILVSKNVGALTVMETKDCDIINDNEDINEIKEKIEYLLEHPNNERILKSIDFEANSFKAQGRKLELICEKLYNTV